jgi:hypothetical protein
VATPTALLFGQEKSLIREAAERGLRRLGFDIQIQIPGPWSPADAERSADAVVTVGIRGKCAEAAEFYAKRGIPVAMLDLGHLRKPGPDGKTQFRVTPPRHDWLPEFEGGSVPYDRLDALGIEVGERRRVKGQHVQIAGQLAGDSAHGKSRGEVIAWAQDVLGRLRSLTDSPIVWRPHPSEVYPIQGVDGMSDPANESLAQALEKTWLLVTWNSTAGLEALIAGLPVVAEGPAVYSALSGSLSDFKGLKAPDRNALRELLAKLAYTQWSPEEIATGMPIEVALGRAKLQGASAPAPVETAPPPPPLPELEPTLVVATEPDLALPTEPAASAEPVPDAPPSDALAPSAAEVEMADQPPLADSTPARHHRP